MLEFQMSTSEREEVLLGPIFPQSSELAGLEKKT
jgi:hypothetical protein